MKINMQVAVNLWLFSIFEGFRPSRKTDIEKLIYTLLFLLKKGLPCEKVKAKNHIERCQKICQKKKY